MTKTNSTIVISVICFVTLCVICLRVTSLITGTYDEKPVKILSSISRTDTGRKLIHHYRKQLIFLIFCKVKYYEDLKTAEREERYFVLAGFIFAGLIALFASLVSLVLFIINGIKKRAPPVSKTTLVLTLLLIILNGTIVRLILASACYGNYDMQSYEIVTDIVVKGGNVYAETNRYNYSPAWFMVLGTLKRIQHWFPALSFHFVVKSFLCGVDLLTLAFLLLIARHEKISIIGTAIFFYLNPVSFLITGYHGQFENLSIFMVVIGLFTYVKLKSKPVLGRIFLWIFATIGMIIKHNIFYELIICLNYAIKRYWIKLLLFVVSVCIFLVLFLPYLDAGSKGIIRNVFGYSSDPQKYGINSLFNLPVLKYVFIVGMLVFPFLLKSKDIVRQCLLGMLFFVVFATGFSIQYFVLPIALGALRPSKGFLFYSMLGSMFILGCVFNVFVPILHLLGWNTAWVGALCWFVIELRNNKKPRKSMAEIKE